MEMILGNEVLVLLAVIFTGCSLGLVRIRGIGMGNTACLFTGLVAGAMGASVPQIIEQIGILFFVYSIGLSMGPRFFHLFKGRTGLNMIILSVSTVVVGVLISAVGSLIFELPEGAFIGAFAGSLTSTPTLASALDALIGGSSISPEKMSIAYTVTYPLGFLLIVLFVQYIPRIYNKKFQSEMELEKNRHIQNDFQTKSFLLANKNFIGKNLKGMAVHRFCHVNVTRIKRGNEMIYASPDTVFEDGDIAIVVGLPEELSKFESFFGGRCEVGLEPLSGMNVKDIVLANTRLTRSALRDLRIPSAYGVTVTRIRRSGTNITPHGNTMLEMGDEIRIFGSAENIKRFAEIAGSERKKLDETNIVILSLGMFAGLALGHVPFEMGGMTFRLGTAGGSLLVALLLGHFGKIGRWSVRLPIATRIFLREFGIVFFLSSVGVSSGSKLIGAMMGADLILLILLGAVVAVVTMVVSYFIAVKVLSMPIADSLGAVCGAMTSTPALGVLINQIDDDSPTFAYASVYPIATILLTVSGQLLVWFSLILASSS